MLNFSKLLKLKRILRIISWLALDIIFVNMVFYSAYLVRFNGIIEIPAFLPYLKLWPHITGAHLVIFFLYKLYVPLIKHSKRQILKDTFLASLVSCLTSISIVYAMRNFFGFIPFLVFAFAGAFNIILVGGWRIFVRYES